MPNKSILGRAVAIAAIALAFTFAWHHHVEQADAAEPVARNEVGKAPQSILVLRSGGVLYGRIEKQEGFYTISTEKQRIRLRMRDVEFVCANLQEAYALKRAAFLGGQASEHLALAEWCLRLRLYEYVAKEILDARRLNPRHPRIKLLENRLAVAMQQANKKQSPVLQASMEQAVTHPFLQPNTIQQKPSDSEPENQNPDPQHKKLTTDDISGKALEEFSSTIQPLLLNSCATSGCHVLGGAQEFQLDRFALLRAGNRKTTLKNLRATLEWMEKNEPLVSPLVLAATETKGVRGHGRLVGKRAPLARKLQAWVYYVAVQQRKSSNLASPTQTPPLKKNQLGKHATSTSQNFPADTTFSITETDFNHKVQRKSSQDAKSLAQNSKAHHQRLGMPSEQIGIGKDGKSTDSQTKKETNEVKYIFSEGFFQNESIHRRTDTNSSTQSLTESSLPQETYEHLVRTREPPRYVDGLKRGNWLPNFSGNSRSRMQLNATIPIMQQPEDEPVQRSDAFDPEIFNRHFHPPADKGTG